jgi:hypothetical protein
MNPVTVVLGVAAVAYGGYTAWARQAKPEQFQKLDAMKEQWGDTGGYAVHVIGYTVVPILVGVGLVVSGLNGGSAF